MNVGAVLSRRHPRFAEIGFGRRCELSPAVVAVALLALVAPGRPTGGGLQLHPLGRALDLGTFAGTGAAARAAASRAPRQADCDPLDPEDGELGYRRRQGRCEGLFRQRVSSSGRLRPVSLLQGRLRFELRPDSILEIVPLSGYATGPIRVKAIALPAQLFYQMDATLRPPYPPLSWPVREVLYPLRVSEDRLGVVGWVGPADTPEEMVYVPLRVRQRNRPPVSVHDDIELTVQAPFDMSRLSWRWYAADRAPSSPPPWRQVGMLVTAGHTVTMPLPRGPAQVLRIEVNAEPRESYLSVPVLRLRVFRPALP